jgi:hypothetical protein
VVGLGAVVAYLFYCENQRYWLEEERKRIKEAKDRQTPTMYQRAVKKILKGIKDEDIK